MNFAIWNTASIPVLIHVAAATFCTLLGAYMIFAKKRAIALTK